MKWIHVPSEHFNRLCLAEIEKEGSILLTYTKEENGPQIAEFVIGSMLAFAKNLFQWKKTSALTLWDAKWRHSLWDLKKRIFVQVGMEEEGLEIARMASLFGMEVISIDRERTFHPYCKKHLSIRDLKRVLPEADVVSVHIPRGKEYLNWFGQEELTLMKQDAILIHTGGPDLFQPGEKIDPSLFQKLKGAVIDAPHQTPIPASSKLWEVPNLYITPNIAARPKAKEPLHFRVFRYNLRQYIHGNFTEMKNLLDTSVELASE